MAVGKRWCREQPESHTEWNTLHSSRLGSRFGELGTAVSQTKTSPTLPLASRVCDACFFAQRYKQGTRVVRLIERVRRRGPVLWLESLPAPGVRMAEWSEGGGSLEFESSRSYLL